MTEVFATRFRTVFGLDNDWPAIAEAQRSNQAANTHYIHSDATELPFPDNRFDIAICAQVYEHCGDTVSLLNEVRRVLRPGGICFFSGPNRWWPIEDHYGLPFLHWLPRRAAGIYLRLSGRGAAYREEPMTGRSLRRLMAGFAVEDYGPRILTRSERYLGASLGVFGQFAAMLAKPLAGLLPNFNWVLRKLPHDRGVAPSHEPVPATTYDNEYFLDELEGYQIYHATGGLGMSPRVSTAVALAKVVPGESVLDVGCGRGEAALAVAIAGARVWAVDYSPSALPLAARTLAEQPKAYLACASAASLPFAPGSFDVVLMTDLIEHLTPLQLSSCFEEAVRCLRPGGRLVIHTMPNIWYYRFGYPLFRTIQSLRGKRLPSNPRKRWRYVEQIHINEQSVKSLSSGLRATGLKPRVWVTSVTATPSESKRLRFLRQLLARIYPLNLVFCNDIFAVAVKPLDYRPGK